jgi:hypothetical protein
MYQLRYVQNISVRVLPIITHFFQEVKIFSTGGLKLVLNRLERKKRPYALYAFLWAFLLSAFIVVPVMIRDGGYFLHYGDFNVQEIPFYQLAHDSIQSGNTGWSHLTDLGANFVGSYSFYLLGSPFFLLTLPLPSAWVPYTIGPLLALKLGFSSMTAYIYLKRYVRDPRHAVSFFRPPFLLAFHDTHYTRFALKCK